MNIIKDNDFTSNLFKEKISVRCEGDKINDKYVNKCIEFFNKIPDDEINNLVNLILNDYKEFKKIAESVPELPMDNRILKYVNPQIMWINADKNENADVEFLIECTCEWNLADIEIIASNGKIKCVMQYTGDFEI